MIRVMGLDPGLGTFGLVVNETDGETRRCLHADVFTSEPLARKLKVEVADDRVRRTQLLARWLEGKLTRWAPHVVAAEAMSFPRNQIAVVCICLAWGVIVDQVNLRGLALVTAMPRAWRQDLVPSGKESHSHAHAIRACPSFVLAAEGITARDEVHARDALGVAVWSERTNNVRAIMMARAA